MPRIARLLAALLVCSFLAFAQDSGQKTEAPAPTPAPRPHPRQRDWADQRLKRLTKRLTLTQDQQEKIRPILQDEEKQMKALDEDAGLTTQQKHRKMREIRMSSRSQMDGILTDDQKKLMGNNGPHGTGPHHGHRNRANPATTPPDSSNPQ